DMRIGRAVVKHHVLVSPSWHTRQRHSKSLHQIRASRFHRNCTASAHMDKSRTFSLPPQAQRVTIRWSDSQSLYALRSLAMSADRNLLFAVLALQADCVTREQFIDACTAWAANKATPIDALMVQKGWLTVEDRADVERLVERKLKKHGGNVRKSLAEVAGEDVRQSLAEVPD